jgi:hypothetical protein
MYFFLYLYQVSHFSNHAAYSRIIVVFNRMLQFAQSQGTNGILLIPRVSNRAPHIFYTQFSHDFLLASHLWPATTTATPLTATAPFTTAATPLTAALATLAPASTATGAGAAFARLFFASSTRLGQHFSSAGSSDGQAFGLFLTYNLGNGLSTQRCFGIG